MFQVVIKVVWLGIDDLVKVGQLVWRFDGLRLITVADLLVGQSGYKK